METTFINDLEDFSLLYKRIIDNDLAVNVDVSGYHFFNPKEILMLTQFFVVQNDNGIDGTLICDNGNGWYFDNIKLVDFCNSNFKSPCNQKQSCSTAIPIKRIDVSTMGNYIQHALDFFSCFCVGKDTDILNICISEIINNVSDHSRSLYDSYIFSQYYPKQDKIKFAISDLGVGIPRTVNDFLISRGEAPLLNYHALDWAIQKGKTSQSRINNKGLGLYNVTSYLKNTGTLEIFSDDVWCLMNKFGKLKLGSNPIKDFKGTLISVDINIKYLESEDETILDGFSF